MKFLILNTKKMIGMYVYNEDEEKPFGKATGICFSRNNGNVNAFCAETLSLIPVKKTIPTSCIKYISPEGIVLKKNKTYIQNKHETIAAQNIARVQTKRNIFKKIKSFNFDCETGEIIDITAKRNTFDKKVRIAVNKIELKDNTIYVNDISSDSKISIKEEMK